MDYCEFPSFYRSEFPKAVKAHKCCECSAKIEVGERYEKYSGMWDGKISTFKQHKLCADACRYIRDKFQDGECIGFGELSEHWKECSEYGSKTDPKIKEFRSIMAKILKRERLNIE